jgi:hypothetical protein
MKQFPDNEFRAACDRANQREDAWYPPSTKPQKRAELILCAVFVLGFFVWSGYFVYLAATAPVHHTPRSSNTFAPTL